MKITTQKILRWLSTGLITLIVAGCTGKPAVDPEDPYEKFNRGMFAFNMAFDHMIFRPAAKVYTFVTPSPLRQGISNAFNNINGTTTIPNDILQGKFKYALIDFWRLAINTTLGIGGLFDVATRMHLPKHYEDFGMTLAYYSADKRSPYLVIPFLGPSTFRDAYGKPMDLVTNPYLYVKPEILSYALVALRYLELRSELLPADKMVDTSFDPYVFVRSAYTQTRQREIEENEHDYTPGRTVTDHQDSWIIANNPQAESTEATVTVTATGAIEQNH